MSEGIAFAHPKDFSDRFLVDEQGTIQYFQRGYGSGLEAELRAEIESLVAEVD